MISGRNLLFFIIVFACTSVKAQWVPYSQTIPSPNASSLGLYGELPVSYFTGVPDISVPLYTVKGKKISLPISLSYNASGLRPEVHPGWVGNGWTLLAGGGITRKAKGLIDEYNRSAQSGGVQQGYYFTHSLLNNSNWVSTAVQNTDPIYTNPNNTVSDGDVEPDEFDFNFLGYSGKFFLDQTGKWQVQCDQNLTVSFNSSDFVAPFVTLNPGFNPNPVNSGYVSNTFGKFTITDEAGDQYVFGSMDIYNSAIEFSDVMVPSGTLGSSITATTWYLSEIISADASETINLNYVRGPLTSYVGYGFNASQSTGQYTMGGPFFVPTTVTCYNTNAGTSLYSGNIIFPVYLSSITMPAEDIQINFTTSASTELNYLTPPISMLYGSPLSDPYYQVYTPPGSPPYNPTPSSYFPSQYLYYYSTAQFIPYFASNPPPGPVSPDDYANRLIWLELNQITIQNTSGNKTDRTISLFYNNNPLQRLRLNAVNIVGSDGVSSENYNFTYNSTPLPSYLSTNTDSWGFNNNNTTPFVTSNPATLATVRAPDPTGVQTQAEILTGIQYPTGGTTTFTYQPNTYYAAINRATGVSPSPATGVAGGLRISNITSVDNNGNSLSKNYYYVTGYTPGANVSSLPSSGVLDSQPTYQFSITGESFSNTPVTFQSFSSNPIIPLTTNSTGTHIGYSNVVEQRSDGSYTTYQYTNSDNGYNDIMPPTGTVLNPGFNDYVLATSLAFERGKLFQKTDYNSNGYPVSQNVTTYSSNVTYYTSPAPTLAANAVYNNLLYACSNTAAGNAASRTAYLMEYFPFVPIARVNTTYDLNLTGSGNSLSTTVSDTYDQYKNIIERSVTNSDGTIQITRYFYPYNFTSTNANNPYNIMVAQNMNNTVIEQMNDVVVNGVEYVIGGTVHTYQAYGSDQISGDDQMYILQNDAVYNFEAVPPVLYASKTPSSYEGLATFGQLALDSHYVLRESFFYDPYGNINSVLDNSGRTSAYVWDFNGSKPVASIKNASNVYPGLPPASNPIITNSAVVHIGGTLYTPNTSTITVAAGTVGLSFAYANTSIPGNNTSTLGYQLTGTGVNQTGTLCASTPGGTSTCGSTGSTATLNVPAGTYTLTLTLETMNGFQNYYGYNISLQYPVSQYVTNTAKNDVAYTSFEYNASNTLVNELSYGTGNWTGININNVVTTGTAISGHNYYTLTGTPLTSLTLNSAETYVVSYWSQNGVYSVTGSQSYTQGITLGAWTFFKHIVTGVTAITVSGTGSIDELRLYPLGSLMSTYTYEPLVGVKTVIDQKQEISNFAYDGLQRLTLSSDQYSNPVKAYAYNFATPIVSVPVINSATVTGNSTVGYSVTINYTPLDGCTNTTINYTNTTTGQPSSSTGGCEPTTIGINNLTAGNYTLTITCNSTNYPSAVTSLPATFVIP